MSAAITWTRTYILYFSQPEREESAAILAPVLIENGHIADINLEFVSSDCDYEVIDCKNGYLLPGLIDSHVHIHAGPDLPVGTREEPIRAAMRTAGNARKYLECGFTTVRSMGGTEGQEVGVREAVKDGLFVGPDVVASEAVLQLKTVG